MQIASCINNTTGCLVSSTVLGYAHAAKIYGNQKFEIDPIKETLIYSGFERIVISIQSQEYDILDVPAFARGLVFSPVIEEIRERGGVEPEEIVAALAEALKREYGSNLTRYPMQAILFEAGKP